MRVQVTHFAQQLASGHPGEPLASEDQGNLLTGGPEIGETCTSLRRRRYAHHAVVPCVAVAQGSLDVPQDVRIVVNGDQHRPGHQVRLIDGCRANGRPLPEVIMGYLPLA